jgi:hypothetical protein
MVCCFKSNNFMGFHHLKNKKKFCGLCTAIFPHEQLQDLNNEFWRVLTGSFFNRKLRIIERGFIMSSPRIQSSPTIAAPVTLPETTAGEPLKKEVPAPSETTTPNRPSSASPQRGTTQLAEGKLQADTRAAELHAHVDTLSAPTKLTTEQKRVDQSIGGAKLNANSFQLVASTVVDAKLNYEHRSAFLDELEQAKNGTTRFTWTETGEVIAGVRRNDQNYFYTLSDVRAESSSLESLYKNRGQVKNDGMTPVERVHVGLDILGFAPVVGEPADLLNGAIYAYEGDYVNAAISAGSAAGGDLLKAGKYASAAVPFLVWKKGIPRAAKKLEPAEFILAKAPKVSPEHLAGITKGVVEAQTGLRGFDNNLLEAVKHARNNGADNYVHNYAAMSVRIDGDPNPKYFVVRNMPGDVHSEKLLLGKLENLQKEGHSFEVVQVFSERVPCSSCKPSLKHPFFSGANVFWAVNEVPERGELLRNAYFFRRP